MAEPLSIENISNAIRANAKYTAISPELVQWIIQREMQHFKRKKEIVQRTRSKLHQVASAFQEKKPPYGQWLADLEKLPADLSSKAVKDFCLECMAWHSSTRERLPVLDDLYRAIFEKTGPVTSILDLACGSNPLALPWMELPETVCYYGCDIYTDQAEFLNAFFRHMNIDGRIDIVDLVSSIPDRQTDVALLLKTVPCLEQLDKAIGTRLLEGIQAKTIVVSFPVASLGGKGKGMLQNYETHFQQLTAGKNWNIEKLVFASELVFLLNK